MGIWNKFKGLLVEEQKTGTRCRTVGGRLVFVRPDPDGKFVLERTTDDLILIMATKWTPMDQIRYSIMIQSVEA